MRLVLPMLLIVAAGRAAAVPGPDSTAILANASDPQSVALAQAYADARNVPARQLCAVTMPTSVDVTFEELEQQIVGPLEDCLRTAGVLERIEAVVIARGVPLRVVLAAGEWGEQRASVAAALGVFRSETIQGQPLLGMSPGTTVNCGAPCFGALWKNPYVSGAFHPGWQREFQSVNWRPLLVTMLHGRSYEDAGLLIEAALEAERVGGATGEFLLMRGADPARGVLDQEYLAVRSALQARGIDVVIEDFQPDLEGRELAAFVTGTASLGRTIEGNTYAPGALTDNLTSLGALPVNFEEMGEAQVSIARWVAAGAAGAHGATDEPLNNTFPSRELLVSYVDGYTLAESYLMAMPYVYWRNLVLGDPMLAPYAVRPEVTVETGECLPDGRRAIVAAATDAEEYGVDEIAIYVDGVEAGRAAGDSLTAHAVFPAAAGVQVLAVAQKAAARDHRSAARPKGWTELRVDGAALQCAAPDLPGEGQEEDPDAGGCTSAGTVSFASFAALLALLSRRRVSARRTS